MPDKLKLSRPKAPVWAVGSKNYTLTKITKDTSWMRVCRDHCHAFTDCTYEQQVKCRNADFADQDHFHVMKLTAAQTKGGE